MHSLNCFQSISTIYGIKIKLLWGQSYMKNEKIYLEILKMIDREERILRSLNVVKELIENDGDGSAIKYNIYKLMDIYEESQNW